MRKHGLHPRRTPGKTFAAKPSYDLSHELAAEFTALICRNEDVAVIGRGDSGTEAFLTPTLTSLATPCEAVAEAAVKLMAEIQKQRTPRHVVAKPHLAVRESCGAKGGGSGEP